MVYWDRLNTSHRFDKLIEVLFHAVWSRDEAGQVKVHHFHWIRVDFLFDWNISFHTVQLNKTRGRFYIKIHGNKRSFNSRAKAGAWDRVQSSKRPISGAQQNQQNANMRKAEFQNKPLVAFTNLLFDPYTIGTVGHYHLFPFNGQNSLNCLKLFFGLTAYQTCIYIIETTVGKFLLV